MPTIKHNHRLILMLGIFLVGMLVISACGSQPTPVETQESAPAAEEIAQSTDAVPTEEPVEVAPTSEVVEPESVLPEEPDSNGDQQGEGYPAPGYQFPTPTTDSGAYPYPAPEEAAPPPVKTALEATNPAMVVLASGKPQLIEFFAFW